MDFSASTAARDDEGRAGDRRPAEHGGRPLPEGDCQLLGRRFHCYEVPDLPRTDTDLERRFGTLRYHERRATGRRSIPGGAVVRGAVRVVTVLPADQHEREMPELRPSDPAAWQALRQHLEDRQDTRRAQRRFRRDPDASLATLEREFLH
jgi:hypothetical protein